MVVSLCLMFPYCDDHSYRVYCVIGDGESAEGSIWEAMF